MNDLPEEQFQEKMWIEIIQCMENMYAELAKSTDEIQRKNEELQQAYQELHRMQGHLIQTEKMRSLGRMAAGIAHELNNPIGAIIIYSYLLLEDTDENDPRRENIERIVKEGTRCKDIVKELLGFAKPKNSCDESVSLKNVLENTISILSGQAMFHNIKIVNDFEQDLPWIKGNSGELQQAFTNIILNAVQAMEGKGELCLKLRRSSNGKGVIVCITDTGCGIAQENLKKIFEPFFTTKRPGEGTGLGLAITYGIIERHMGTIEVESQLGKGATFRITFPPEGENYEEMQKGVSSRR